MSLASLLLGGNSNKSSNVDNELDTLFKSQQPTPLPKPVPSQAIPKADPKPEHETPVESLNRKRKEPPVKKSPSNVVKRQKPDVTKPSSSSKSHGPSPVKASTSISKTRKGQELSSENSDSEDDDPALEDNYLSRTHASKKAPAPEETDDDSKSEETVEKDESSEDEDDDYDLNAPPPKHETQTTSQARIRKKAKKSKYVPPDESPAQRDARTIFIGNVPIEVIKSRPAQKQLKRHILSLIPQAKIESIRFRSVAFSTPTASLEEKEKEKKTDEPALSTKEKRQKERADSWRKSGGEPRKEDEGKKKNKSEGDASEDDQPHKSPHATLTPAQRKRVAFYKHEFHKEMDSSNAYLVFAHLPPGDSDEDTPSLHPAEAARLVVEKGNGTTFMSRTLRIDRVGQWRAGLPDREKDHISLETLVDPQCTLFVGNLDFAAKDEDLRTFFDSLVTKEMDKEIPEDQSTTGPSGEVASLKKRSWVKNVRIIRDKDTQLGKGFAYVRFIDRECVDEILALEPGSVKFAKRKLRLQRCKGVPGATPKSMPVAKPSVGKSPQSRTKAKANPPAKHSVKPRISSVSIPKGDPNLGAKLVSLSKEERKVVKAADSSRIERRLAKKQAKSLQKGGKTGSEKLENKRHRQRKNPATLKTDYDQPVPHA
ncbi:hypothetical protein Clacol_007240 [Clathrus columnatus]|uniref:Nucleolar protein 12 n=1 Tax=Clathrus columnatus TaxID=1419009 RepID=A0AAV5AEC6_9AGAM|nr:hypothetical protein Clacol_007240 [Clathrus columnatus]